MAVQLRRNLDVPELPGDKPCQGAVDVFYPPANTRPQTAQRLVTQARATCYTCPHWEPCLQGAFDRREEHGVWGGVNFNNPTRETKARRTWRINIEANEIRQARQENAG